MYRTNAWSKYKGNELEKLMVHNEKYKAFISVAKTERECVTQIVQRAQKKGFVDFNEIKQKRTQLSKGDKVYHVNRGKNVILMVIGEESMETGMRIIGTHIDSPHIDLKQNPLYENAGLGLADTHYYGGIKKYQWVALPLAIHGVVIRKDGSSEKIVIGEHQNDPVTGITDILWHLSEEQMEKAAGNFIDGEDLDVLLGSMPTDGKPAELVKANIIRLLGEKYKISEEDLISAELQIVPAGSARDFGIDKSMVMAYGHDDRVCAYAALEAILDVSECQHTNCAVFFDKEEVGNISNTGASSMYFENVIAETMAHMGTFDDLRLRRALSNSKMISGDVSPAVDPIYTMISDSKNAAYLGKGISLNKFTGWPGKVNSNDAHPEYIAELRTLFEEQGIYYQTAEPGKVDLGAFQTIAYVMGAYNMDVIDAGVPVLNMHAPWEIVSKADVFETYLAYKAFLC
ncbi:aminopeptidase [Clostridiales bacterium]|jgi:aspartyl aminopeptidase|nr:aminopeptidase [Clostridiales bacterium]